MRNQDFSGKNNIPLSGRAARRAADKENRRNKSTLMKPSKRRKSKNKAPSDLKTAKSLTNEQYVNMSRDDIYKYAKSLEKSAYGAYKKAKQKYGDAFDTAATRYADKTGMFDNLIKPSDSRNELLHKTIEYLNYLNTKTGTLSAYNRLQRDISKRLNTKSGHYDVGALYDRLTESQKTEFWRMFAKIQSSSEYNLLYERRRLSSDDTQAVVLEMMYADNDADIDEKIKNAFRQILNDAKSIDDEAQDVISKFKGSTLL